MAMTQADKVLIGQVMLYSQGFRSAESLSSKVSLLFGLCEAQLSSQSHYDFGLRSLKAVLRIAGNLKRAYIAGSAAETVADEEKKKEDDENDEQRLKAAADDSGLAPKKAKSLNEEEQSLLVKAICATVSNRATAGQRFSCHAIVWAFCRFSFAHFQLSSLCAVCLFFFAVPDHAEACRKRSDPVPDAGDGRFPRRQSAPADVRRAARRREPPLRRERLRGGRALGRQGHAAARDREHPPRSHHGRTGGYGSGKKTMSTLIDSR